MNAHPLSVVICTYNPRKEILARTLEHLGAQRLESGQSFEIVLVDNNSSPPLQLTDFDLAVIRHPFRLLYESQPGQMNARRKGFAESNSPLILYLDDDNFLDPDYIARVLEFFTLQKQAGVVGARIFARLECPAPAWFGEDLYRHLAVRDLGTETFLFRGIETPFGAGMVVRREAMAAVMEVPFVFGGRKGARLSSGDDSELCYRMKAAGWELWYCGRLSLEHYLFQPRLTAEYMERFHYAMGYDRPILEMFWASGQPWRRLTYLRRSVIAFWRSLDFASEVLTHDPRDVIHRRFERARYRGLAISLWRLVWGSPIWRQVPALKPD